LLYTEQQLYGLHLRIFVLELELPVLINWNWGLLYLLHQTIVSPINSVINCWLCIHWKKKLVYKQISHIFTKKWHITLSYMRNF